MKTLIKIFGKDAFFDMIRKAPAPKNPKYKQLIDQAFAITKLNSAETTVDKLVELVDYEELEFMADIAESFKETKRLHDLRVLEHSRELMHERIIKELYGSSIDNKSKEV